MFTMTFNEFYGFIVENVAVMESDGSREEDICLDCYVLEGEWLESVLESQFLSMAHKPSTIEVDLDTHLTNRLTINAEDDAAIKVNQWLVYFTWLFPRQFGSFVNVSTKNGTEVNVQTFLLDYCNHWIPEPYCMNLKKHSEIVEEPSRFFCLRSSLKPHVTGVDKDTTNNVVEKPHTATPPPMYLVSLQGRYCNYIKILQGYFPRYLRRLWCGTLEPLFHAGQGPLPLSWRHYLAILAAKECKNDYIFHIHRTMFLLHGGDPSWITSLEESFRNVVKISPGLTCDKLQNDQLHFINGILAHQPWRLSRIHVQNWYKSAAWSMAEMVQAVCILTTVHSLCALVSGCGVNPEPDQFMSFISPESMCNVEKVLEQLVPAFTVEGEPGRSKESPLRKPLNNKDIVNQLKQEDTSMSEVSSSTIKNYQEFCESDAISESTPGVLRAIAAAEEMDLTKNRVHVHEDFNVKSTEYRIFRLQDFCWEDQGCSLVNKYLPNVGDGMDLEFSEALNMTDHSVFEDHFIDTSPVRQAVWYYVLRLSGMCHDDFNYALVNRFLPRQLKSFIKKVVFQQPSSVSFADFSNVGLSLRPDEKVHICILASLAKKQSALLYFLALLD